MSSNHRVVLYFDDGLNLKLICPESGCSPASICGECHRTVGDDERQPCAACPPPDGECWIKGWFDNCTYDELLYGEITVDVECEWDGDHIIATVVDPVALGGPAGEDRAHETT